MPDPLAPTARWSANTVERAAPPPMGWNSYNAFEFAIDEDKILCTAQKLVDSGLAAKGYRCINLDEGWVLKRRMADGHMILRADKFPAAQVGGDTPTYRPLSDRLHAMGLKGIYSEPGRNTCGEAFCTSAVDLPKGNVLGREVGLYGHLDQDMALDFKNWGFDYVKVDGCGLCDYGSDTERFWRTVHPS